MRLDALARTAGSGAAAPAKTMERRLVGAQARTALPPPPKAEEGTRSPDCAGGFFEAEPSFWPSKMKASSVVGVKFIALDKREAD